MSSASPHSRSPAPDAASRETGADASPTVDAVAGAAGALLALLSTYPLMTLNTRQHTERGAGGFSADSKRATRRRDGDPFAKRRVSMFDELRAVAREDGGLKGLYRGIEPAVIGTMTSQTVYNYFYAVFRNASARRRRDAKKKGDASPSALESLAIASVAGAINVVLTIPIWTVCVRMQAERANEDDANEKKDDAEAKTPRERASGVSFFSRTKTTTRADGSSNDAERSVKKKKKTFLETTAAVWHENGLAGFWRGVVPSLMMVANPALQYAFYERAGDSFLRRRRPAQDPTVKLTAWEVFLAASFAKMGATVLTYPVLLVKTRLQASEGRRRGRADARDLRQEEKDFASYDGAFDAIRRIAREEGVLAFYRGMGTKMTQTVFAAALMFVTKEEIAKAVAAARARVKRGV